MKNLILLYHNFYMEIWIKTVLQLEPNAKSSKAFEVLADNLMNGTHNELSWGIGQMFSHFLSNFKVGD